MKKTLATFAIFLLPFYLTAQEINISGNVKSENGSTISGVNITDKNSGTSVTTDQNGNFTITANPKDILEFYSTEFSSYSIEVSSKRNYSVVLKKVSEKQIEGVVITALGIAKKKEKIGYSTQEVGTKQFESITTPNIGNLFSGQVAGLNVSNPTGMQQAPEFTLRGNSNLVFVIDGVIVEKEIFQNLDPNNIENINVLKGAPASALYGSRGRYGAVLITTKSAKKKGFTVEFSQNTMVTGGFTNLPKTQTEYGNGSHGQYEFWDGADGGVNDGDMIWGPKFVPGTKIAQWNSPIRDKVTGQTIPWYGAVIGKFYRAYYFFNLSLKFGSIPYSEALKGESGITQPKYNTQETVMSGILSELKEANDLINSNDKIEGDIIYNGDATKWKKLINSFRLKILITMSKKTTLGTYNIATEFASIAGSQPLMTSISDNGELKFADAADSRYTMFNNSGYGSSLYMADYFINLFKARQDPRLFTFAAQTTGAKEAGKAITDFTAYNGGNPTSPYSDNAALVTAKNISKVNDRFYKDATNEPSSVLSYPELQFILAEATARGWISGSAKTHYDNAIKSSFNFYQTYVKNPNQYFAGFDVNQYLTTSLIVYNDTSPLQTQLEKIMTQKYMTMFHQSQWTSYYDYLRTGFPNYPLQTGVSAPFRFRYPQSEYNYNSTNLKAALTSQYGGNDNINSKPWWLQ